MRPVPGDRNAAVVTLSGGLDSTVAALIAAEDHEVVLGIGYDYGQRALRRELAAGYEVASWLGVPQRTVELPFFRQLAGGALLERSEDLPRPADLDDPDATAASAAAVWVPNRNGVMVAVAAAWAESLGARHVVVGFNAEEAATFPDNGPEFVEHANAALAWSTRSQVKVLAPTLGWSKADIVRHAMERDWPLELVWSCYDDQDEMCGACESCRRFERALDAAGARKWYSGRLQEERNER